MAKKICKLAQLSPRKWAILLQLILFSWVAALALRLVGLPRLVRFIAQGAVKPWPSRFPLGHNRYEVGQVTSLVELATRVTHGHGRCLARSLLMFWILKVRGEPAELLIGVRKEASALRSHAWIEARGIVMSDSEEITGCFATLLRFCVEQ